MNSLLAMIRKDIILTSRSKYFLIIIAVALFYAAIVRFLIPVDMKLGPTELLADASSSGQLRDLLQLEAPEREVLSTRDELLEEMKKNSNTVGVYVQDAEAEGELDIELIFQGNENEQLRNLLAASITASLEEAQNTDYDPVFSIKELQGSDSRDIPFHDFIIPLLLFTEAGMVGIMLIAALIFMEKEEKSYLSYVVSGQGIFRYLLAKCISMVPVALVFTAILLPLTLGFSIYDPWALLIIIVLGSMMTAVIAAGIAAYFRNFSEYLAAAVIIISLFSLPAMTYLIPTFSPVFIRYIPTYPLIFGMKYSIFGGGDIQSSIISLALYTIIAFAVFTPLYSRQMQKGAM